MIVLFTFRSADRCLPFFQTLKANKKFEWTKECEEAFQRLKTYLASPPILVIPVKDKPIYVYLASTDDAISSALVLEDGEEQKPIYFTSKTLTGAEKRYHRLEKLTFSLLHSTRKLRHYYQQFQIIVRTDRPLKQMIKQPDIVGRMSVWSVEISEYGITYEPRRAIKGQALADFIAEMTGPDNAQNWTWSVHIDGAA